MAYTQLEDSFHSSMKVNRCARALGIAPVLLRGHLATLWSWALIHAPDGDLSAYDDEGIEEAVEWDGEPGAFIRELSTARGKFGPFLERTEDGLQIHDWWDRAMSLKRAQAERDRRAKKRADRERQRLAEEERAQEEAAVESPEHTEEAGGGSDLEGACATDVARVEHGGAAVARNDRSIDRSERSDLVPEGADASGTTPAPLRLLPDEPPEARPAARRSGDRSPEVMRFPVKAGGDEAREWTLTEGHLAELEADFGDVLNVREVCTRLRRWVIDNPGRRKTAGGMPKFISGRIKADIDSGRGPPPRAGTGSPGRGPMGRAPGVIYGGGAPIPRGTAQPASRAAPGTGETRRELREELGSAPRAGPTAARRG